MHALLAQVVDSRLDSPLKREHMADAIVAAHYGAAVSALLLARGSVDGVISGRALTAGAGLASTDGVHYSDHVYDAMAQVQDKAVVDGEAATLAQNGAEAIPEALPVCQNPQPPTTHHDHSQPQRSAAVISLSTYTARLLYICCSPRPSLRRFSTPYVPPGPPQAAPQAPRTTPAAAEEEEEEEEEEAPQSRRRRSTRCPAP